ncbi:hypothetical protein HK102_007284, partial [Quaeritorhiza haematococci]
MVEPQKYAPDPPTTPTDLLRNSLVTFYRERKNVKRVLDVINRNSKISLRVLDWFIVSYARDHQVVYNYNGKMVNVYTSYKAQLKSFSKRQFDPFRRNTRMLLHTDQGDVETTIAQL